MPTLNEKVPSKGAVRRFLRPAVLAVVAIASLAFVEGASARSSAPYPNAAEKARIDRLIVYYSKRYNVPVALSRRVVQSESEYRALARNGPYWGLMQIRYDTAQGMGYRGPATGLLDAETNLAYGIAYLANAVTAANGNMSKGHMLYRKGYYYEAKRRRVLDDMIVVRDFKPVGAEPTILAMADVEAATGALWSGETDPTTLVIASAPMPRPKPGELAAPALAEAPAVAGKPVVAKPAVVLASAAGAPAAPDGPPVAKPTVVYASVLPLSRGPAIVAPAALRAPASSAPALLAAATDEAVMSPVADPTAPIPRPRPGSEAAAADAPDVAPVAIAAADMPVPRPRPDATAADAVPVVVVAQHVAVPLPRARPLAVRAE